jgi:succinoglycan biosynthesis transport protein ExoP
MVAAEDNFSIPVEGPRQAVARNEFILSDIRWILRRGWMLSALGGLIGLAAAFTVVLYMPEAYKSSARILLDRTVNRYLQTSKIVDEPTLDDADISSQIYVLSSDSIVVPVIRSLNLTRDPEFVGRPDARGQWGVKKLIASARNSVVGVWPQLASLIPAIDVNSKAPDGATSKIDSSVVLERTAVEAFLKQLSVIREDAPNVINITFASENPVKAANIANALAEKYVATVEERKINSSKMISQLLESRLLELKKQTDDADRALQNFIVAHNLVGTTVGRVGQDRNDGTSTAPATNNELIMRLRTQYVELAAKANELESQLGPTHLAVLKLRNQMAQLHDAIKNEDQRSELGDADQAKLRELESSAAALHSLYDSSLRKYTEANQIQPDTEDAHIITSATPPLHKNYKKALLLLGGGLVFGLFSGLAIAASREWLAGVFRTPAQVRQATGIYCAVLPKVSARSMVDYVLNAPYTRFTETIRNTVALIKADQRNNSSKTIGVVSSVSSEGKTTVATNLAALLNAQRNGRVLIIDCDLHRRSVTAELAPDARESLLEVLEDVSRLPDLVVKLPRSGVDVLPCAHSERMPNAAELLGSHQMERLLDAARKEYDYIIVEIAPIASVVDIKMIERFIDSFIFVVEWGKTKRTLVDETLSEVEVIRDRILCVLLNKADPAALRTLEAYKGPRAQDYYLG